jgi:hypothetical protein
MDKECKCKQPNYNPVGRCLNCGDFQPAGTYPNTQLPAEVLHQINDDSFKAYPFKEGYNTSTPLTQLIDINTNKRKVWREGATEYAIKQHQVEQEKEQMKNNFDLYKDEMAERRIVNINAIKLLKKVIERHEAGLLPDSFIYNEIKGFLDGAK